VALSFINIFPHLEKSIINEVKELSNGWSLIIPLLFAPIFETSILVFCIHIAKQIFEGKKALIFSAFPICILHGVDDWQLPFIVFAPFFLQVVVHEKLRPHYGKYSCMLFLAILHSSYNLIAVFANR
jgi:hypothetical protein